MRRSLYNRRRREYCTPMFSEWALLIIAWLIVLPFACCMVYSVFFMYHNEIEDAVADADEQQHVETAAELHAKYRFIPGVNRLRGKQPTILIYHTHTTEAYTQTENNRYEESGAWRTKDNQQNVVAVGEKLKEILERDYGFYVIHDTTDHEPPKLADAYERSLLTMQAYHKKYPSIVLFLDLHRDAYNTENAPTDFLTINGTETAKLMFVVGRGEKYEEKPYYESNYALAEGISAYLNQIDPKLARPIRVKTGRYNQHVAPNCLLVEVGHNANTLEQAKAAMTYLAESIAYTFRSSASLDSAFVPN